MAKAAEVRRVDFKPQSLANTVWAFATAGRLDVPLFAALVRTVELRASECNAQDLANAAWAF